MVNIIGEPDTWTYSAIQERIGSTINTYRKPKKERNTICTTCTTIIISRNLISLQIFVYHLCMLTTTWNTCGWRQEEHPVVKTLLQYEEQVQPYGKTDYKPMIYIYTDNFSFFINIFLKLFLFYFFVLFNNIYIKYVFHVRK